MLFHFHLCWCLWNWNLTSQWYIGNIVILQVHYWRKYDSEQCYIHTRCVTWARSFFFYLFCPSQKSNLFISKSVYIALPLCSVCVALSPCVWWIAKHRRWCTRPYTGGRRWPSWSTGGRRRHGRVTSSRYSSASSSLPSTSTWRAIVSASSLPPPIPPPHRPSLPRFSPNLDAPALLLALPASPPPCCSGQTWR